MGQSSKPPHRAGIPWARQAREPAASKRHAEEDFLERTTIIPFRTDVPSHSGQSGATLAECPKKPV
jgi:hypothetical protein